MARTTDNDLLTVSEAAQILGRSRMALHLWIKKGALKAQKYGPVYMIQPSELARLQKHNGRLTTQQAATALGITADTVYTLNRLGRLKGKLSLDRLGRKRLSFSPEDVENYRVSRRRG